MQKKTLQPLCPFCEPNVDAATFAGSEHFRAVYDISPILPGHSLVTPKRHVTSLMDLSEPELGEMMVFSRQVLKVLLLAFQGQGFDWTIQEGKVAGQSVPHLHLHLLPRKENDLPQPGDWYPLLRDSLNGDVIDSEKRPRLGREEMGRIVRHLRQVWEGKG
jgi:bis(5'-adenosyl)-triphosphatase